MGSYRINISPHLCTEISGLASDDITSAVAKWIRIWYANRLERRSLCEEGRLYVGDCHSEGISIWTDETDEKKLLSIRRLLIADAEEALRIVYEGKFVADLQLKSPERSPLFAKICAGDKAKVILKQLKESKSWSVELLRES